MSLQSIEFLPDQPILHEIPPYGISARFFCGMYKSFGMESSTALDQFTYGVCDLSRIVDDAIDKPDVTTPGTFDELVERLKNNDTVGATETDSTVALRYVESLNEDQLRFANDVYREALEVVDIRVAAQSVKDYVRSIKLEAEVQCKALAVSEDSGYADVENRKRYNAWLKHFTLAGYCIDSALDMPTDFSEGRTQIRPTLAARLSLLAYALRPGMTTANRTPVKALPLLGGLALGYHVPAISHRFSNPEALAHGT